MKILDLEEFQNARMANGRRAALVINVLAHEEYAQNHIPGSVNVPYMHNDRFAQQVEDLAGGPDKNIILYCGGPQCPMAANAARVLADAGFGSLAVYEGGMAEWDEYGGFDLLGDNVDDFGGRGVNYPPPPF